MLHLLLSLLVLQAPSALTSLAQPLQSSLMPMLVLLLLLLLLLLVLMLALLLLLLLLVLVLMVQLVLGRPPLSHLAQLHSSLRLHHPRHQEARCKLMQKHKPPLPLRQRCLQPKLLMVHLQVLEILQSQL